jgi:hypothetical protein
MKLKKPITLSDIIFKGEEDFIRQYEDSLVKIKSLKREEGFNYWRHNSMGYTTCHAEDVGIWSLREAFEIVKDKHPYNDYTFEPVNY